MQHKTSCVPISRQEDIFQNLLQQKNYDYHLNMTKKIVFWHLLQSSELSDKFVRCQSPENLYITGFRFIAKYLEFLGR